MNKFQEFTNKVVDAAKAFKEVVTLVVILLAIHALELLVIIWRVW